jgi:beta-lactamase class A
MYTRSRRRRSNKPILIPLVILILAGAVFAYLQFFYLPFKVIAKTVTLEVGSTLPTAAADYLQGDADKLALVEVDTSAVKMDTPGQYKIILNYQKKHGTVNLKIVDTVAPTASLIRDEVIAVQGRTLTAADLVTDVKDKTAVTSSFDLEKVVPEYQLTNLGNLDLTLYLRDTSGNTTNLPVKVRVVEADKKPPTLSGVESQQLNIGQTFDPLAGVAASDEVDGDLTQSIQIEGQADLTKTGYYTLSYSVSDSSGNKTSQQRTITVADPYSQLRATNVITVNGAVSKPLNAVLDYLGDSIRFMGIVYQDLNTGDSFAINPDNQYRSASTAKLFVNMALYNAIDEGKFTLDQTVMFQSSDFESGTGILQGMDLKVPYALSTLADYAIIHSDNIAFNMIRRTVGREACFDYYDSIIGHATNRTSTSMGAGDGAKLMAELYHSDSANFKHMLEMLRQTKFNDMLPRDLPQGIVAHKVGFYNAFYHDVGIVFDEKAPYIITVFSNGLTNPQDVIANVSKLVYDNR